MNAVRPFRARLHVPADTNAEALNSNPKLSDVSMCGLDLALAQVAVVPGKLLVRTDGDASACAVPLPPHPNDPSFTTFVADPRNLEKLPVHCTPVKPGDSIVVAPVPPFPQLD